MIIYIPIVRPILVKEEIHYLSLAHALVLNVGGFTLNFRIKVQD
jgi:hypothetical protein